MIQKVVILGTGNVAWHLAHTLPLCGVCVVQVFGRSAAKAENLALSIGAEYASDYSEIYSDADFYIYAISDDQIAEVAREVKATGGIHIHTSGSVDMSVFEGLKERYGVLYPSQTFTIGKKVDFGKVAIFVEGSSDEVTREVEALARRLTLKIFQCSSEMRRRVHLVNVISSNFANALWVSATELLRADGLRFVDVTMPLVEETIDKLRYMPPAEAQTGPARRGDRKTIDKHMQMLAQKPELAEACRVLTELIIKQQKQ